MRLEALHPIQCYVSDGLYVQPAILRSVPASVPNSASLLLGLPPPQTAK